MKSFIEDYNKVILESITKSVKNEEEAVRWWFNVKTTELKFWHLISFPTSKSEESENVLLSTFYLEGSNGI